MFDNSKKKSHVVLTQYSGKQELVFFFILTTILLKNHTMLGNRYLQPSKQQIHNEEKPEKWIRKNRCRHERVRYHSSPSSEDEHSGSASIIHRDDVELEKNSRKHQKCLVNARRFGIDPPPQTVDVSNILFKLLS